MPKDISPDALVLTVPEAGKLLGVSRNTSYSLAKTGRIPTVRLGGLLRVPKAALERMLEQAGEVK